MKISTAVIAFALTVSSVSFASPESARAAAEKYARMADELKFTPEQREKLKKIQEEYHKTLPGKRHEMEDAHDAMEAALRGSGTNDEVRKKYNDLEKKQNDFARARFEKILAIRAILTPEQREKFNAYDDKAKPDAKPDGGNENKMEKK